MPFKEIKQPEKFIRVHEKEITISKSLFPLLLKGVFSKELPRIKVFVDDENRLIGLQPALEGYKLSQHGGSFAINCIELKRKLEKKDYYPEWSKKHKMLIFSF